MAERRLTRQELNRLKKRGGFIGRQGELDAFRANLRRDPQSTDFQFQYLFHVHGNGGVGKTSLIRQWEQQARERGALTVTVGDEVHGPVEAMETIAERLRREGTPLKAFENKLKDYRKGLEEAERARAAGVAEAGGGASVSPAGMAVAQVALAGATAVPLLGAVAGAMDPAALGAGVDRWRTRVAGRSRMQETVPFLSPVKLLTPVFLDDLAAVARQRVLLVLFFDVYERTGPVLDAWLRDMICTDAHGSLEANVVVVLSGQGRLDDRYWADWHADIADVPLDVFTEQEARDLLRARGVTDPDVTEVILRLSGRLPVLVDMLAHPRPASPGEVIDPAETAVERFLKWENDPDRRAATLACALPLHLDEDVYRALAPRTAADRYDWLRGLPFVGRHDGRAHYHDTVRALMVRHQRDHFPTTWTSQHATLAHLHRTRREAIEATLTPHRDHSYWYDAAWREICCNETYHLLCANPGAALPAALADTVHACYRDTAAFRQWAHLLGQAATDTGDPDLARWADQLAAADEAGDGDAGAVIQAVTVLLTAPTLPPATRAVAHIARGYARERREEWEQALTDYDGAVLLTPDNPTARLRRGEVRRFTGRFDDALADLDRAVELDPDRARAHISRGRVHRSLERYDEATADFDQAIRLCPDSAGAYAHRGETHRRVGRYEDALADLGRAIQLEPDHPWAHAVRGGTHSSLHRYEEALADLDRAIQLDPDQAWIYITRGSSYRLLERYDEAVADLDRAIRLSPDSAWAYAQRGDTYRRARRYEDALADLDHAVQLGPEDVWARLNRAAVRYYVGRYRDAIADLDHAVRLEPDYIWAYLSRGIVHQSMGRYEEAAADLERALTIGVDDAGTHTSHGDACLGAGRYEDAIAAYDQALRPETSGPETTGALIQRGEARLLSGDTKAAREDLTLALERSPGDDGWAHLLLALAARQSGQDENGHWARAVDAFTVAEDDVPPHELFLLHCLRPDPAAPQALDGLLARNPAQWVYERVLNILDRFTRAGFADGAFAGPLRQRLEAAYEAARARV
ncbi:tetratricopeptide repeat protein [Streptomyces sp. NPDC049879]|uniref:tetratricopeptide repeat protein n=1 Tax=Streptomyces sp. NPDC049879 TaxID=3365598 RepID=UPI0037BB3458